MELVNGLPWRRREWWIDPPYQLTLFLLKLLIPYKIWHNQRIEIVLVIDKIKFIDIMYII